MHQTGKVMHWDKLYTSPVLDESQVESVTLLEVFRRALRAAADEPAILYFDGAISYREMDELSSGFAASLSARGFKAGDRLAIYLQNMPHFVLASIAAWKLGGIVVPLNPMHRSHELGRILPDCTPKAVVAMGELVQYINDASASIENYEPHIFVADPWQFQTRNDPRVLPERNSLQSGHPGMFEGSEGTVPNDLEVVDPQSPAFIVYTSGTTGEPKGAILTHDNIVWSAASTQPWMNLDENCGPVLGMAPLFHITGLVAGMVLAWQCAKPIILSYRFHPQVVLDAMIEHRPGFVAGAITAYIALMSQAGSTREHYSSFRTMISGGAATPLAVLEAFRKHSGHYLQNGYGLTETSAGIIAVPCGVEAPCDLETGTLSVGVPMFGAHVWIADDDGRPLPPGKPGEIVLCGRGVSPGYWQKPEATRQTMQADGLRTGDVGFIDDDGWVYVVDRIKDMIIASGFKVWPREVEDVLYAHPAIREAAVIGVRDDYRGENVRAVISLKPGERLAADDLIAWCRQRLAAYKVPREIVELGDLPKNPAGKILRRALRETE